MSQANIKAALEIALGEIIPEIGTAYENDVYTPVVGTPYQEVYFLFSEPDNNEYGSTYREIGYMQLTLNYPLKVGTHDIDFRISLIRDKFVRGASFTQNNTVVVVNRTPEVGPGEIDGDRYTKNVFIRFYANIGA